MYKGTEPLYEEIYNNKISSEKFDVPELVIAGAIYIEQYRNVDIKDHIVDTPLGCLGMDTSLGLGQVYMCVNRMEKQGLIVDIRRNVTIKQLNDDFINVMYVGAYLSTLNKQWQSEVSENLSSRRDI